jgi:hypothetical protein
MAWLRENIEAAQFKQVPGGYIFRMPSPWLFGTADYYLISERRNPRFCRSPRRCRAGC